jgi:hypothetical protein
MNIVASTNWAAWSSIMETSRLNAHCNICRKKVTAILLLKDDELSLALSTNGDVKVMHATPVGDHVWNLSAYDKANLRQTFNQ